MGKALLLEGARVLPKAAVRDGFEFFFPGVEESLAFQLGRVAAESGGGDGGGRGGSDDRSGSDGRGGSR